ncbi:hypothetical protein AAIA72_01480 [Hahella sp. SMD15-11]|uniref:Uncharacterized protein n=1 Tax=Thermohahella caldifontis TaxID=3142973 RepID=A0AB39UWG9_9GAMM
MLIEYRFEFESREPYVFEVDTQRPVATEEHRTLPAWTRLGHCQCVNCPLGKQEGARCPAAVDLIDLVDVFHGEPAFQKVRVEVTTPQRGYFKRTSLEEGLRSLMGLVMATSGCPILGQLRPLALHHMPFASEEEFILRSVSMYLLKQYFQLRENGTADWQLKGLIELNRQLQLVNQAMWQRIHSACEQDSNLKALLSFFSLASSVTFSLEAQLLKLRQHFLQGEPPA